MSGHAGPFGAPRAAAREAARRRHPTARAWAPDRARLLRRLAARAEARGARWPRVAAAVVLLRGVTGDDRPGFAHRLGVPEDVLAHLEAGDLPADAVPGRLRGVPGLVDWAWVDAAPPPT
ncbi:MAG: hypothetical protein JXA83_08310 [Acidimicrobiales bacterium]|nr:hypothetical protein [Acidimicrobiales bacterium]